MKKILVILLPFLFFISCSAPHKKNVEKIIDGDTFILKDQTKIRLFGIDAPESYDPKNNFKTTTGLQHYYAVVAKNFINHLINNKHVIVKKVKLDPYGRTVAKVFYQKQDIAKLMVKQGLVRVAYISLNHKSPFYTNDINYYNELMNLQTIAKFEKNGLWKCACIKDIYH